MTLTERQMSELQAAIERRRAELEEELGGELKGAPGSDADAADTARDVEELHALEVAAARIMEGSYGRCIDCGADIGYERLRAAPEASRCVDCQRRHEKTHAVTHSSTL